MVTVTLSETYDLSTKLNKMSLIGIHTPSADLIRKTYPGLILNNRFMKLLRCDVKLACASILPADVLQVGVSAGQVAPQDMFNPILYKAVSNESMSNFVLRLQAGITGGAQGINGESVDALDDNVNNESLHPADDFGLYYNLLSNRKGFKIAHPQAGLSMFGLRPFVYEQYFDNAQNEDHPENPASTNNYDTTILGGPDHVDSSNINGAVNKSKSAMFGRAHPMPKINTMYLTSGNVAVQDPISGAWITQNKSPDIMPIYCGLVILPPAKQHILYYRLVVRWHVALFGIRPIQEIQAFNSMSSQSIEFYHTDYAGASKSMDTSLEMVDTQNADIEKIMEGA